MKSLSIMLMAVGVLAAGPAAATTLVELRVGSALGTLLIEPGGAGRAAGILPASLGLGLRLGPSWRVGVSMTGGIPQFSLGVQVDHALRSFAVNGPLVRAGVGYLGLSKNCEIRCDSLYADEFVLGVGPAAELGVAWRWSFDDDEGGVALGLSGYAARLRDLRSQRSGTYVGGTLGPWFEVDW